MAIKQAAFRTVVVLAFVLFGLAQEPAPIPQQAPPSPKTLRERAELLKSQGKDAAEPAFTEVMFRPGDYEDLLEEAELVVEGRLLQSRSRPSANGLFVETLSRFQVDEVIKGDLPFSRGIPPDLPAHARGMRPQSPNEIYVAQPGGAILLEGVLFRESTKGFPQFQIGGKYILFLRKSDLGGPGARRGYEGTQDVPLFRPVWGPVGCIEVDHTGPTGRLVPFLKLMESQLIDSLYRPDLFLQKLREIENRSGQRPGVNE